LKSENHHREYRRYYDVLELVPGASLTDVRKAYIRLKELYSTESLATIAVEDELPGDHKTQILSQVQEAYHRLRSLLEKDAQAANQRKSTAHKAVHATATSTEQQAFDGQSLKRIREELKISLEAIAAATRVPLQHLENIEEENFDDLPAEVFTRGFVVAYARHLALDVEKVVSDYMQRYREGKSVQVKRPGSRLLARLTGRK
jgi:flagellar biosynthesis protein FlhG